MSARTVKRSSARVVDVGSKRSTAVAGWVR
jgi:hypothetical protein